MEEIYNIKIVCRPEQPEKEIYLNQLRCQEAQSPAVRCALQFLEAFSPELLVNRLAEKQKNAVLVFRTSSAQMQEFSRALAGELPPEER